MVSGSTVDPATVLLTPCIAWTRTDPGPDGEGLMMREAEDLSSAPMGILMCVAQYADDAQGLL